MVESNNNMSLLVKFIKRVVMSVTDIHKLYKQATLAAAGVRVCGCAVCYLFFLCSINLIVRSKISCPSYIFSLSSLGIYSVVVLFERTLSFKYNVA